MFPVQSVLRMSLQDPNIFRQPSEPVHIQTELQVLQVLHFPEQNQMLLHSCLKDHFLSDQRTSAGILRL